MKFPKLALAAACVAFFLAAIGLLSALRQPSLVLPALIPLASGVAILRKCAWGAFGFALFELAQTMFALLAIVIHTQSPPRLLLPALLIGLGLAVFFFFAGRSLVRAGAKFGPKWPWVVVAALFSVPLLFVQAYVQSSGSMENTILIGDHLFLQLFPKPAIRPGDIVAFRYPVDRKQIFVKRVIGVPGDRIHMTSRVVYRNGTALKEPYAIAKFPPDPSRDNLPVDPSQLLFLPRDAARAARQMFDHHVQNGEVVVPPGKYFVLGDNRDNSLDSRYWGFVDTSEIIGKPFLIYDSEESAPGQPLHVRWSRLFKVL